MPDGRELNAELEYKERVKKMPADDKLDYLLDKAYEQHVRMGEIEKKCDSITHPSKKQQVGVPSVISAIVAGVVSAIMARFGGG